MNKNYKIKLWILIIFLISCNESKTYKVATLKYYGKTEVYDSVIITDQIDLEKIKNSLDRLKPGIGIFKIDYILELKNDNECIKLVGNFEGSLFRDSALSYQLIDTVARKNFKAILNKYIFLK